MAHSSWGSGWENCQGSKIDSSFSVSGTRFPGGMRHELVDLVTMLVQECKNRGYRFGTPDDPSYGCWGFSCRCISGSNNPSNHSWGLAVDINAPSNPYTSPLVTDMPGWMPDLWNAYGFRWGGDYSGSKDAMHYEFMGSVSDAAEETAKARAAGVGGGTVMPEPEPPKPKIPTLTEVGMFIVFGPGGARLCGPGYTKNLDGEEYDALMKVPGMQKLDVDQRAWDVIGAACMFGEVADDVGQAVWARQIGSHINPGTTIGAGDMLAYIDEHTQ
jgi:D-alanyl-D-alanine carboxypeptidase